MINAPQIVIDTLNSDNFKYANIVTINLGDAYGDGNPITLYLTDCAHDIEFDGHTFTPDKNLVGIDGISRKASTGSDAVDIVFSITDEDLIEIIKTRRYINELTRIDRVLLDGSNVIGGFAIPVRAAWGLNHKFPSDDERTVVLVIDSTLGDLDGDNGWYAVNSSHEQRYLGDKIMKHGQTVMTDDQQKKYTVNFDGIINEKNKPPALSKIYGYKNVALVPICMLNHRKSHTGYKHYFTTMIYAINIGECDFVDINNLKKDGEGFDYTIVNSSARDVGGWSVRVRTPDDADAGDLLSYEDDSDLSFWFEGMDSSEKARMSGMSGKGLTLLFFKNRNRDNYLSIPPALTMPVRGARVYDPRVGLTLFSRNPALQYADYLKSSQYGAGKRGVALGDDNVSELANHFAVLPESIGNDGINSIFIDVQVDTAKPIVDNMNIWMQGCRMFTSDYYGDFHLRVETVSSTSLVINESELDGLPDYDAGDFTERVNQLTYSIKQLVPDTTEDAVAGDLVEVDVEATFPPDDSQIHTDWLAEDGGIQNYDAEQLDYVTELEQAYYWCMVDSRIKRKPETLTLPIGAIGWLSEVGDVISFSSSILSLSNSLWRIEEVTEDDEETEVSLSAYDDNFYTPDPNAIPDPIADAVPPAEDKLEPPALVEPIIIDGLYYLNWVNMSDVNVNWYAVEIYTMYYDEQGIKHEGELFLEDQRVIAPPFLLDGIISGSYRAKIIAVNNFLESEQSIDSFDIDVPVAPVINIVDVGNFNAEFNVTKGDVELPDNSVYEIRFSDADQTETEESATPLGELWEGVNYRLDSLTHSTEYFIYARVKIGLVYSAWSAVTINTTNDPTELTEFLGFKSLNLTSDSQVFSFREDLSVFPAVINFTAEHVGIDTETDPITWSESPDVTLTGTGDSRTLSAVDFGDNDTVSVTVTSGAFSDTITIVRLEGGGVDGQDSLAGYLTNEVYVIDADESGNIGSLSDAGGSFRIFKGLTDVTGSCTFTKLSQTGVSASIDTSGIYTVSSMSADSGVATFRATYTPTGTFIDLVYSIAKAKRGDDGEGGVNGIGWYLKPINGTVIKNGVGSLTVEARYVDGESDTLAELPYQIYVGTTGYGTSETFDSTDIDDTLTLLLKNSTNGEVIDSLTLTDLTDGESAIGLSMSSTAQAFKINQEGAISPSIITFTAQQQNSNTETIWSTTPAVALSGTGNTKTMSAANFGANTSVEVNVQADGLTDIITVVKLIDGVDGENSVVGYLTNEVHVLPAGANGTVTSYDGASGIFKVFEGITDVSDQYEYQEYAGSGLLWDDPSKVSIGSIGGNYQLGTGALPDNIDTGYVVFSAARVGYPTLYKTFSVSKSKQGEQGQSIQGERGAGQFYGSTNETSWTSTVDAIADAATAGSNIISDRVTISNIPANYVETRYWNGSNWTAGGTVIDGNLVVNAEAIINKLSANYIQADKIDVTTINLKEANWGTSVSIYSVESAFGLALFDMDTTLPDDYVGSVVGINISCPSSLNTAINTNGYIKAGTFQGNHKQADGQSVYSPDNPPPSTSYSLPTASASTKGGVKVGTGLNISSQVLSVDLGTGGSQAAYGNHTHSQYYSDSNHAANLLINSTSVTSYYPLMIANTYRIYKPINNTLRMKPSDGNLISDGTITANAFSPLTGVHYFHSDTPIDIGNAVDIVDTVERDMYEYQDGELVISKLKSNGAVVISQSESKVCAGIVHDCIESNGAYLIQVAAVGDNRSGKLKGFKIDACEAGDILCTGVGGSLKVAPQDIPREVVTFKAMGDAVDGIAYGYF